uniref:Uncharacterized protein n=1 Tax=Acrobeloides nanus TaxID=290746 RepID=A0A914CHR8_9BILA
MDSWIAIDLGSSFIRAAIFQDNYVRVLPIFEGETKLASVISNRNDHWIFGTHALRNRNSAENTIFDALRVWKNESFRDISFKCPYRDGNYYQKLINGNLQSIPRCEVVSILLNTVRENLKRTGIEFENAVLTIPDFATQHHKRMVLKAAEMSNIKQVRLINASTAAAMHYNHMVKDLSEKYYFMILHIGGGSTSVTVYLKHKDGKLELVSAAGDPWLGGEDITGILHDRYGDELYWKTKKNDLEKPRDYRQMRDECEKAKTELTLSKNTELNFDIDGTIHTFKLNRNKFKEHIEEEFSTQIRTFIEEALKPIPNAKQSIKHVLFIGGSAGVPIQPRIPHLPQIISQYLPKDLFFNQINFDEAVIRGAALKAGILEGKLPKENDVLNVPIMPVFVEINGKNEVACKKIEKIPFEENRNVLDVRKEDIPIGLKIFDKEVHAGDKRRELFRLIDDLPNEPFTIAYSIDDNGVIDIFSTSATTTKSLLAEPFEEMLLKINPTSSTSRRSGAKRNQRDSSSSSSSSGESQNSIEDLDNNSSTVSSPPLKRSKRDVRENVSH